MREAAARMSDRGIMRAPSLCVFRQNPVVADRLELRFWFLALAQAAHSIELIGELKRNAREAP